MDDLKGNENRARQEKAGVYNRMTPCDGGGVASARPANDLPPPIRGDAPMTLDPHAAGRHSYDNLENKPGMVDPAQRATETRRRIYDPIAKYKY